MGTQTQSPLHKLQEAFGDLGKAMAGNTLEDYGVKMKDQQKEEHDRWYEMDWLAKYLDVMVVAGFFAFVGGLGALVYGVFHDPLLAGAISAMALGLGAMKMAFKLATK